MFIIYDVQAVLGGTHRKYQVRPLSTCVCVPALHLMLAQPIACCDDNSCVVTFQLGPEEYVFAAVNLYLDVINLFIFMLVIVAGKTMKSA